MIRQTRLTLKKVATENLTAEQIFDENKIGIKILRDKNFPLSERMMNLFLNYAGKDFVQKKFNPGKQAEIMIELFDKIYDSGFDSGKKAEIKNIYLYMQPKLYKELQKNFAGALENYAVDNFFMRSYPHAFTGNKLHNIKIFVTEFKILEFTLIIKSIAKFPVTKEDFIETVYSVTDKLDHSRRAIDVVLKFAENISPEDFSQII